MFGDDEWIPQPFEFDRFDQIDEDDREGKMMEILNFDELTLKLADSTRNMDETYIDENVESFPSILE